MKNTKKPSYNSTPIYNLMGSIVLSAAYGGLLFGPVGALSAGIFGLVYQTTRLVAIKLSYDRIREDLQTYIRIDESKVDAFNQGVASGNSYVEYAKTFIPGKAAYKQQIFYYAGLGANSYYHDRELITEINKIKLKTK